MQRRHLENVENVGNARDAGNAQNAENEICHRHTHQLDTDTQCYTHMINNNAHAHDSPFGVAMILATESP